MKKTIKKAQKGVKATADSTVFFKKQMQDAYSSAARNMKNPEQRESAFKRASEAGKSLDRQSRKGKPGYDKDGFPIKKQRTGGKTMLKRADGSVSQRGLWDNIRANKGSGKKPTAQMLKQERKIKANSKKK
jgi:hypothetical protein